MKATFLQDRLNWGLNRTANILGSVTDAYRPRSASDPLAKINRYIRIPAYFSRMDGNFSQPVGYGIAVWRGIFDASYTQVGDYLVQTDGTWFIIAQQSLLPVLCVKTNRVLSINRQLSPTTGASYDPSSVNSTLNIISGWPASILGTTTDGKSPARLPGDTAISTAIALLPSSHGQSLQPADIIIDDRGTTSLVVAAELTDLGWRLNVRNVST